MGVFGGSDWRGQITLLLWLSRFGGTGADVAGAKRGVLSFLGCEWKIRCNWQPVAMVTKALPSEGRVGSGLPGVPDGLALSRMGSLCWGWTHLRTPFWSCRRSEGAPELGWRRWCPRLGATDDQEENGNRARKWKQSTAKTSDYLNEA